MFTSLKQLSDLYSRAEKRNSLALLALMVVSAAFEVIGLAAVPAFVTLLGQPDRVLKYRAVRAGFNAVGAVTFPEQILWGALALSALYALKNIYTAAVLYLQARYVYNRQVSLASRLFRAYLDSPYTFHVQRNTAHLLHNISNEAFRVTGEVIIPGMRILMEFLALAAILAVLLIAEPGITFVLIVLLGGASALFLRVVRRKVALLANNEQLYKASMMQRVNQGLGAVKDVKVLGCEDYFAKAFLSDAAEYTRAGRYKSISLDSPRLFLETVAVFAIASVAAYSVHSGRSAQEIVPVLTLFAMATLRLAPSAFRIVSAVISLRFGLPALHVVHADMMALGSPSVRTEERTGLMPFGTAIEFQAVTFRYPGGVRDALQDASLKIERGTAVGFVGPSGAGKTTAVDILLGLLKPSSGRVLVDGVDIQTNVRGWQRQIGYVPQHVFLTDDSVRRNVAFGIPDSEIDDSRVWAALTAAQLRELVQASPDGLESQVGERGVRLSGGQMQRVGIARALYHDPAVLVFDEATSALDHETEREIVRSIESLRGTRTIVMIAHRTTTVRSCDQIFLFEGGSVTPYDTESFFTRNVAVSA